MRQNAAVPPGVVERLLPAVPTGSAMTTV